MPTIYINFFFSYRSLLIIFRLWRIVKVVESVIKSVSFTHEEELESLKEAYKELESQLKIQEEKNQELLNKLGQS